jgi:hypothetical protein
MVAGANGGGGMRCCDGGDNVCACGWGPHPYQFRFDLIGVGVGKRCAIIFV